MTHLEVTIFCVQGLNSFVKRLSHEFFLRRGIYVKEGVILVEQRLNLGENALLKWNYCITYFGKMPRKDIFKKIDGMAEPDRKSLALSMQLSNLILKKYHLDPGFHLEINLQMDEKPELMRQIQREIFAFLIDQQNLPTVNALSKEMEEEFKLYKANKLIERSIHPWTSNLFFSTGLIRDDLKERHFYQMFKFSLISGVENIYLHPI